MSGAISPVDRKATRSHAADWIELKVLESAAGSYRSSQYISALSWDSRREGDDDEGLEEDRELAEFAGDPEIMDGEFDDLLERATDEIRWRQDVLGDLYPFELAQSRRGWVVRIRNGRKTSVEVRLARTVYVACLLVSAARHDRLPGIAKELSAVKPVADAFQRMVFLVSPALLGGPSFWIAFPRPEGDDYGPALERLTKVIGSGLLRRRRPPSQKSNKDGGVDIITWRPFLDGRSNILVSYGQVASGKRWRDKSVKNKLKSHFHKWFEEHPTGHYVPAMYIPHLMHEEIRVGKKESWDDLVQDDAHTLEMVLGVVIDRVRMTLFVPDVIRLTGEQDPAVLLQLRELAKWVSKARNALRAAD